MKICPRNVFACSCVCSWRGGGGNSKPSDRVTSARSSHVGFNHRLDDTRLGKPLRFPYVAGEAGRVCKSKHMSVCVFMYRRSARVSPSVAWELGGTRRRLGLETQKKKKTRYETNHNGKKWVEGLWSSHSSHVTVQTASNQTFHSISLCLMCSGSRLSDVLRPWDASENGWMFRWRPRE